MWCRYGMRHNCLLFWKASRAPFQEERRQVLLEEQVVANQPWFKHYSALWTHVLGKCWLMALTSAPLDCMIFGQDWASFHKILLCLRGPCEAILTPWGSIAMSKSGRYSLFVKLSPFLNAYLVHKVHVCFKQNICLCYLVAKMLYVCTCSVGLGFLSSWGWS